MFQTNSVSSKGKQSFLNKNLQDQPSMNAVSRNKQKEIQNCKIEICAGIIVQLISIWTQYWV